MTGTEPVARLRRRRTVALVTAVLLSGGAGTWVATAPDAVATPAATGIQFLDVGESLYIGYYPLSDDDLVIHAIEPVTLHGLETALWLCDPSPATESVIGAVRPSELEEFCGSVVPFEPETVLAGRTSAYRVTQPYLLVEITSTHDGPQALCSLDIAYRKAGGWRTGRQPDGGSYRVGVNWEDPDDSFDDTDVSTACGGGRRTGGRAG